MKHKEACAPPLLNLRNTAHQSPPLNSRTKQPLLTPTGAIRSELPTVSVTCIIFKAYWKNFKKALQMCCQILTHTVLSLAKARVCSLCERAQSRNSGIKFVPKTLRAPKHDSQKDCDNSLFNKMIAYWKNSCREITDCVPWANWKRKPLTVLSLSLASSRKGITAVLLTRISRTNYHSLI